MIQNSLLFSPITINQLTLRNRIIMPAIHLNYTPSGKVTDQLVAFYAERAKGGAGLLIAGGCAINDLAGGSFFISIKKDSDIKGLARLAKVIHNYGASIGVQLYMAGAYAHAALIGQQPISSSTHVSAYSKNKARGITLQEIKEVQNDFVQAAIRAKEAGFDMVEILGSAGYLISQFLSPKINKRTDQYGGSLENRMRFGLEIINKIRIAVGPKFCISIRIAGNDFVPESHTNNEACLFAQACVEAGVNLINVTGGWHETLVPQITNELPPGGFSYLARNIRQAVKNIVPIAASNRINNFNIAEEILARGDADLVCMCRSLLADPELPKKILEGREQEIHRCVACNQGCFDAISLLQPVGCMVNPRAGHETKAFFSSVSTITTHNLITVVGGGPAGAMAAITAAQRGYQVVLLEATQLLGGQITWYNKPTGKLEFSSIPIWQYAELKALGVNIRLGVQADVAYITALNPTIVILATGARPNTPSIPGINQSHVVQAWDILKGHILPKGKVVILGGGAVGLETALNIARRGTLTPEQIYFLTLFQAESPELINQLIIQGSHQVTVLEIMSKLGKNIGRSTRWIVLNKLKRFNIKLLTNVQVKAIEDIGIRMIINDQEELLPADTIVLATGSTPINELANQLKEHGIRVLVIGDAIGAGSILKSIAQGYKVGLEL